MEAFMDLQTFFKENSKVALAFSGGADSSYLLYAGYKYGANITPYYVKTAFQPAFELGDALTLVTQLGLALNILERDISNERKLLDNTPRRCYHCKRMILETMIKHATEDGCSVFIDGTNASDDANERQGTRALKEMSIRSPLRECGITKAMVRELAKEAGLFTWDKPSYSCLATRIPTGTAITMEMLRKVESAEDIMFDLGFTDFRVRLFRDAARIQLPLEQMPALLEKRESVLNGLKTFFPTVMLDLDAR
jgi:uncharacterized protein